MPIDDAGHGVDVNVRECRCPGTPAPHPDGDIVTLVPKLTLPMAAALLAQFDKGLRLRRSGAPVACACRGHAPGW